MGAAGAGAGAEAEEGSMGAVLGQVLARGTPCGDS